MYSEVGRPSIVPVLLVKLTFIQYTFVKNYERRFIVTDLKSKEKIERVFADAKEKHMRWTTLRGFLKNCRFRR